MRDGVVPAAVVATAVIAFVAYLSFQGATRAVDYAVVSADSAVVPVDARRVPPAWAAGTGGRQVLTVDVAWAAEDSIPAGAYAVFVTTPQGWRHLGCRPECEWSDDEGLREFARRLPRRPYPLAAVFEAEESGRVRVGFGVPPGAVHPPEADVAASFVPAAWLVQTNGDDILGAKQVPLG